MPDGQAVYKQGMVYKTTDSTSAWTNAEVKYVVDSLYTSEGRKTKPQMKCKSCGNIFSIDDNLFDEEHCTFDCKYHKEQVE